MKLRNTQIVPIGFILMCCMFGCAQQKAPTTRPVPGDLASDDDRFVATFLYQNKGEFAPVQCWLAHDGTIFSNSNVVDNDFLHWVMKNAIEDSNLDIDLRIRDSDGGFKMSVAAAAVERFRKIALEDMPAGQTVHLYIRYIAPDPPNVPATSP